MRISNIMVENFKRFTKLEVLDIPDTARLVMLVGPNGSGKSSLLEAVNTWRRHRGFGGSMDPSSASYYTKGPGSTMDPYHYFESLNIHFHGGFDQSQSNVRDTVVVRSPFRNEPNIEPNSGYIDPDHDQGLYRIIDNDPIATRNMSKLLNVLVNGLTEGQFDEVVGATIRETVTGEVQSVLRKLIPDLEFIGMHNPLTKGTFHFRRNDGVLFSYENLSAGEKAAFDLLLDIALRSAQSERLIYCVDEPEAHLNPRVHGTMLKGMLSLLPPIGQLWVATHSPGMMNFARNLAGEHPDEVVFLSFYEKDFDSPVVLRPTPVDRSLWRSILEDSLGDIASLVGPRRLVICEGNPAHLQGKSALDQECYDVIFGNVYPDTAFISVGNEKEVRQDTVRFGPTYLALVEGAEVIRVIDRDERTEPEIEQLQRQGVQVLSRRNLESYLFSEEILFKLVRIEVGDGNDEKVAQIRSRALHHSVQRGNSSDDLKSACGQIMTDLRRAFGMNRLGSTVDAFKRDVLAPLVTPKTSTFADLHKDIFGAVYSARGITMDQPT